jgi:arylsulfatase A
MDTTQAAFPLNHVRMELSLMNVAGASAKAWRAVLCLPLLMGLMVAGVSAAESRLPNVVLIFADDLGYGDIGCYGSKILTPHVDRLAREGVRFTDFYSAQAVCSASRAALLTGCYPNRVGIQGALGPKAKVGLNTNELTIARMLKTRGYATAVFGKWHLGDAPEFLPTRHGFDEYYGLPYSNDMWPHHPTNGTNYPPLPLIEGERVIELMPDQSQLTTSYTERAVRFIQANKDRPFFLYLPHSMPHVPLFVSEKFKNRSGQGLYADVIMEIDWSVGQILQALRETNLERQTIVIFTSDNGPWLLYGDHAGSAGNLREGKATTFEGGHRVPCVIRWPGEIPPGTVSRQPAATIDILPTLAKLTGTDLPKDRTLDGKDIGPLMRSEPGAVTPHEAFFYYWDRHLQAIRSGPWKLHFPHKYPQPNPAGGSGKPGQYATKEIGPALYNLETDASESTNVAGKHPNIIARLEQMAERCREDLGDSAVKREGTGRRH